MKRSRQALLQSVIALLLCFSMLIGTTFAWFTDSVSSSNNTIAAGTLDVEMEYRDTDGNWKKVNENTEVLDKDALWEPGYTEVAYLKIRNAGNLALKYALGVGVISETGSINVAGKEFFLSDYIRFGVIESETEPSYATREAARNALTTSALIVDGPVDTANVLNKTDGARYVTLVVYMPEEVGNAANYATGVAPPEINLGIELVAAQEDYESDSFGRGYDTAAALAAFNFPATRIACSTSAGVETDDNNTSKNAITLTNEQTSAVIPAGVLLEKGTAVLSLKVSDMAKSDANITLGENDAARSLDVHVTGISKDNTVPMEITIKEAAAKGLNAGNLKLFHVENGNTVAMNAVEEFTAHNQFKYDPATGDITLYMATFSEVTLVADTVNAWKGMIAEGFAGGDGTEANPYIIANADQLAYMNKCISNENSTYGNKAYKLITNINFEGSTWYPIGYWAEGGNIAAVDMYDTPVAIYEGDETPVLTASGSGSDVWYTYGGAFKGTFDGAGHTVANIYQNTWQLKGNYDGNYWNAAMGLFGYVYGGAVKNLTVSNFSSDGEFTPTGVIAAYAAGNASFENIAITGCNPRVYNTGNGGIIGIAGDSSGGDNITLQNITVDNSNKISALWGSWDVACGGLVGMFRGNDNGSTISFTNCHVAAQIDVYNDVCANYQYYAYRYAGMIIGSVRNNITNDKGQTLPNMTGIFASDCTVNFGDWNKYYYCEFEENTMASYSEDYQFSRVDKSEIIFDENGRAIGCTHSHTAEEDKQAVYLPFHQLFTGYSWGVSSIGLKEYSGIVTDLDIAEGDQQNSVEKFAYIGSEKITAGVAIKASDLFSLNEEVAVKAMDHSFHMGITDLDDSDGTVKAEFVRGNSWGESTITLEGTGRIAITVQDYYFCTPTTVEVTVEERQPVEKFATKFTDDFLYRVGNKNAVALDSLFAVKDGAQIGNVSVSVEAVSGAASGTYTPNADWTKGTVQFSGTGVVKVTITDDDYCTPTVLHLEVVDAKNITSAGSSLDGTDVVLLNNVKVSADGTVNYRSCTVYGNGFTYDVRGGMNMYNSKQGHGIIITVDATLDNLVIVGDVYDKYGAYTNQEDYTSAVDATNTVIQNCHISNCSTPVRANGVTIKDTTLYGGTVANLIISGSVNTLENVTTVNHNDGRGVLGFGIVISDGASENVKLVLNGELKQHNFVYASDVDSVSDENAKKLLNAMFDEAYSNYHIGNPVSVNTGILSMVSTFDDTDITNNTGNGYMGTTVSYKVGITAYNGYLYSLPASGNSVDNDYDADADTAVQGNSLPTFTVNLGDQMISKDGEDDTRYLIGDASGIEALYQNNEAPIALNLKDLATATKYGQDLAVSAAYKDANGKIVGTDTTVELTSSGTLVFTVTDNIFYDKDGNKLNKSVEISYEVPVSVSVKQAAIKNATITIAKDNINGDYNSSKYMTFNPLEAIEVTDYDASGNGTKVALDKSISSKTVEYANTSSGAWGGATITITYTDGRVLTINLGTSTLNSPGASNGGKTITVQSDGSIKTDGKVANSSATGGTWTINGYSFKGNNGSTVSNNTKVTVTFADESGCVTGDTHVTLADGTEKRIDEVTNSDQLLVWNFFEGKYDVVPAAIIFYHGDEVYEVLTLEFADGTKVKTINVHGFFDAALNKFVFIDKNNVEDYVGHAFVKENGYKTKTVKLVGYTVTKEYTGCYSIQSAVHINFITEGMFSQTLPPFAGWFDYFEIGKGMKYDEAKMQADIEKYGLYDYSEFAEYVTYEQFIAFNGPYLKILVGRGVVTHEQIINLIATYVN